MRTTLKVLAAGALAVSLVACGSGTDEPGPDAGGGATDGALTESDTLTVLTHSSFALPDELKKKFEEETGYTVTYTAPGDAGALVNQLVLTKDSPLGDVVYGVDNTFASRANDAGVLSPYESEAGSPDESLAAANLTPINLGDVCINADKEWFAEHDLEIPATLDDLTKPEYRDLLVVSSPASSSPGLSFLIATIGAKGEGWLDYWRALDDNGLLVVSGWTEAYYTEFSGADGEGPRPLVLSYSTSPAFTVQDGGSTTEALLDTCFRQVEYAGVITGAQNEVGARAFIDFLLSPEVQAAIPENMYMYPVVADTPLPEEWERFAPLSDHPISVSQEEIGANRDQWIKDWTAAIS
ncbi:MAG: thiamine ABC transporter substrate-binding protein [Actinomycetales bacterium]|nr:thiamine ABC transporter substrate-binding protein [Tetrasphaera sp.]NLX00555.1 thiamine ABC transporter substrate-binding protein [Actinomycetales bacterium]